MNLPETITIIGKEFPEVVIPLLQRAKNSVDIIIYDWRWYPDQIGSPIQRFNNTVISARKRSKRVRVITKSQPALKVLEQNKVLTKKWASKKNLHTKLMIIDQKIAILGSHNYTMSAFTINHEVSIVVFNQEVVKKLNKYFQNLWEK